MPALSSTRLRHVVVSWTATLVLLGCGDGCFSRTRRAEIDVRLPAGFRLHRAAADAMAGVSGLTADASGALWAVTERRAQLLPVAAENGRLGLRGPPVPLVGLAPELEAEAIASFGDRAFAIGTEGVGERSSDQLLLVELSQGRARVTQIVDLPYALWGMAAKNNQGIEGVCSADNQLVVAVEAVLVDDGKRYAPVAVYNLAAGTWRAGRLALSTGGGKISGLACATGAQGRIEVLAIERHFGIARLLRFRISGRQFETQGRKAPTKWTAKTELDLHPFIKPLPNFEGLAWRGDRVFLITDNHYQKVTGPTYLLSAPLVHRGMDRNCDDAIYRLKPPPRCMPQ